MAGIAGIYLKNLKSDLSKYRTAFGKMLTSLAYSDTQISDVVETDNAMFGSVEQLHSTDKANSRIYRSKEYCIAYEGLIFVSLPEKALLNERVNLQNPLSDFDYIPYLYKHYKNEFPNHITGQYNILIYNLADSSCILVNDRLGFLPMYCFENDRYFMFSSKIESLLSSNLLDNVALDFASIAEQLYFNYTISDNTLVKDVTTLCPASVMSIRDSGSAVKSYWEFSQLLDKKALSASDSFDAISLGLQEAILKLSNTEDKLTLSLTGGWDSRLLLSYLIDRRDKISLFSFGASNSPDILIPQMIAQRENLQYQSFILDGEYLKSDFLTNAKDTIVLSNGTRHYKRSHYMYAMKQINQGSGILLSGIFGDEVLKLGKPQSCGVFSSQLTDLIDSNFSTDAFLKKFQTTSIGELPSFKGKLVVSEICSRIDRLREKYHQYHDQSQQYYAFRFTNNLRKYFGAEVNSYNDFADCYSPFIDHDFLNIYAETIYAGFRYPFAKASMAQKQQTTKLYAKLVMNNCPQLAAYASDRGYSMRDALTISGRIKILSQRFVTKSTSPIDAFNTTSIDQVIQSALLRNSDDCGNTLYSLLGDKEYACPAGSLIYWIDAVFAKYATGVPR